MKMKQAPHRVQPADRPWLRARRLTFSGLIFLAAALHLAPAHASLFKGETLDKVADVIAWVVLVVVPVIAVAVFWTVHILPEKIAEKRKHPQAKAIQTLCLLSLVFGGLLWPLAFLWAYSKPVLHKMAYGYDTAEPEHGEAQPSPSASEAEEIKRLREQVAHLEKRLAGESAEEGRA
jgi:hypothetical protein